MRRGRTGCEAWRVDNLIVSADGTKLAVRRVGSGPPVVMLHGSGGGLHSWEAVANLLADEFDVWLVARRGYGRSDVPDAVKSFQDEVEDVDAVVAAARAAADVRVHLVGVSYGATLALHAAQASPDSLRSLALYEPPLFAAGAQLRPVLQQYRALLAAGDAAGATMLFVRQVSHVPSAVLAALAGAGRAEPDPDEANRSAVGSLHDLEALVDDSLDIHRWASVQLPTLLMQGADTWDPMPATMNALAEALPHAERVSWDGQMHFACSTAPDLVADTLRDYLRRQP